MLLAYGLYLVVILYTGAKAHIVISPELIPLTDLGGAYGDPACFHMQILFDVSCFIPSEDLERAKNITKYIIKEIKTIRNSSANIGLTLHKLRGTTEISPDNPLGKFRRALDTYNSSKCKLKPETYLEETLEDIYLDQTLENILYDKVLRNDAVTPDVILIVTDGHKHGYFRNLTHAVTVVNELNQNGVEINAIAVPERSAEDLDPITAHYRLYNSSNIKTEKNIVNDLTARYSCLGAGRVGDNQFLLNPYLREPGGCVDRKLGDIMLRYLQIAALTELSPNLSIITESCPK